MEWNVNLMFWYMQFTLLLFSAELPLDLTFLSAVDISAHRDISTFH